MFHSTFFATTLYGKDNSYVDSGYISTTVHESTAVVTSENSEKVEVSLDSFGSMSIVIMLALTSLLGAFFVREELTQ
jgi:hypothetical protein